MNERLHFHFSLSCIGEGNGKPFQCSCLENPRDGRAWWAAVYGVTQSRTWLKRLSSSSSIPFNGLTAHFFLALNNILLFGCTTVYWFIHLLKYTWLTPSLGNYNKVVENIPLVVITMDINLQLLWVNTKDNYWIAR